MDRLNQAPHTPARRVEHLVVVSLNYKSFSLKSLSHFALPDEEMDCMLAELAASEHIEEIVGLKTCNRVEFIVASDAVEYARHLIINTLADYSCQSPDFIRSHSVLFTDHTAVEHLFHLVSSLDSMVTGDAQIFGQVKKAYHRAADRGMVKKNLHTLFQKAFSAAKEVRSQTGLGKGRISISALAVEYARTRLNLSATTAVVIGAGKMGSLSAKYLKDAGVKELILVNRTPERCRQAGEELDAKVYSLDQLEAALKEADLVISSTSSEEPIITRAMMSRVVEANAKPRLLIDITLPEDVEASVAEIEGVTCVNLEAIRTLAQQNQSKRLAELERATSIVENHLRRLGPWPMPLHIDSIAYSLGTYADSICREETHSLFNALPELTEEQRSLIDAQMQRLAERIVLAPRRLLRHNGSNPVAPETVQILEEMFRRECGARSRVESPSL